MKQWMRLTALLAVLALTALLVTACGPTDAAAGESDEIQPLEGETPEDLQGYEFTVVDFTDGRWNKERSGTPGADAWIRVLDEVEALYNCKITPTYLSAAETFSVVQPELMAGGKYADLIVTTQWQFGNFLGANLMMDLNKLEVNWDNPWWNQIIRNMCSFNGETRVAGGSFIFDTAQTWLLYYNEAIWKECGFEDPYKMIDEHRWTQDKFTEFCRKAARDMDQSGELDSYDDRFGLIAPKQDLCRAWYMALEGHYFTANEKTGHVELACNNQHTYDIIEKIHAMVVDDKTLSNLHYESMADMLSYFVAGKSLFFGYMPGIGGLQNMEDSWGVMPFPLFDESQKDYLSGVDHNSAVCGVATTNTDLHQVSVLMEALGRHAMILEDIYWPDYKETYWRHEESDTRVVKEYVVGHGQHDLALIMQNCNKIFQTPMSRIEGAAFGNFDFPSWIDAVEGQVEAILEEYFQY